MKELFVDGFTIGGNPSRKGGGFVIYNPDIKDYLVENFTKYRYTNNEAEVSSLVRALEIIDDNGVIYTDSFIAICWLRRGAAKARPDLNNLIKTGKALQRNKNIQIIQIPREQNLAGIYIEDNKLEGKKFY